MSKRGQEPAYPADSETVRLNAEGYGGYGLGMSLRLRIASEQMKAVIGTKDFYEGVCANEFERGPEFSESPFNRSARIALAYADALLAAEEESR